MASDSQILALSTMFTEDVFAFYGGQPRASDRPSRCQTGRIFVILLTVVAYSIAMSAPQSIFDIASQYAFAGYCGAVAAAVAALFWKKSTKWGALAVALWTAAAVAGVAVLQSTIPAPPPGAPVTVWAVGGVDVIARIAAGTTVLGFLPVVPMTLMSALLMFIVSRATAGSLPAPATLAKYEV